MAGVMVIANRATAARDILSGTIHKLTLWLDDVRRKPDMKLLLDKPQVDEIAVGTEHRLTKKACLSLAMHLLNPRRSSLGKNDLLRRISYRFDDRKGDTEENDRSTEGAQVPIN